MLCAKCTPACYTLLTGVYLLAYNANQTCFAGSEPFFSHGGAINTTHVVPQFVRDLAQQYALTILAGDDPIFFPSFLHAVHIPTSEPAQAGGRFTGIDWQMYHDVYGFNMSDYLHTFADYEERFTHLLAQTQLASYDTVVLNYPRTYITHTTCTIEIPTTTFFANWDAWFAEQTLLVTRDGALVLEGWDDHSFDIRTNFLIAGSRRYTAML